MAGLPRGGDTLPVKQEVGFEPGTLGPQTNALTGLALPGSIQVT